METEVVEDIVIVGAGIAGLTTSLGLHRLGIRSLVLESSDTLRITGFALTLWDNAWKALDAVGVGDILRQQHVQLSGNVTTSLVTGKQTSTTPFKARGKDGAFEIRCVKRQLMLEALVNELPSGTIRFLSKVVAIEESGYYKILHLADGTAIKTKVLIGCDGVNSGVAKWLGFKEASFTGRYAVRGFAESKSNHWLDPKFMQFFGKGFRAGAIPCDEKTVYWFFTWTPTSQVPLRYRHPLELMLGNISKGNVCVVGDAFHPMTPDLGQGGCCALEDGVVLARCLAEAFSKEPWRHVKEKDEEEYQYKRIEGCLKKYANHRRWRSIDLTATSHMVGSIQQGESKFVTFLRDTILAAFLGSLLLKKSKYDCGELNSS
ncbi:monooxygenase 2-like isoform X2 [Abrus precatorius]|uniref:Monooxygenase 2-like isoform X2 n=1 Tax=Abrus precatorius TaxID=3816 RepID=A0A8B8MFU8_ABRPR|nr:monooxygenase 2-like isoform X2 [Abrus precatorius]